MVIVTDEDAKEDEPLKKPNTRKPKPTPNQTLNPKKPTTPKSNKNKIIKETVTTSEEELEVTKSNTVDIEMSDIDDILETFGKGMKIDDFYFPAATYNIFRQINVFTKES